jgi:hypothetical protein
VLAGSHHRSRAGARQCPRPAPGRGTARRREGLGFGGQKNYWSADLAKEHLETEGLRLLAAYKSKKREKKPWPRWLVQKRRRIETVISQLVERYRTKISLGARSLAPNLTLVG